MNRHQRVTERVVRNRPQVEIVNQAFVADGNVATAGGCLASQYLAAWIIARLEGVEAAESAIHYVAPVGEKEGYISRMLANISPFVEGVFSAP